MKRTAVHAFPVFYSPSTCIKILKIFFILFLTPLSKVKVSEKVIVSFPGSMPLNT